MSWHDLIDDASVRRFVSGDIDEVPSSTTLYDTELVENEDDESHGITIVSSVPTIIAQQNSTVLIDSAMLNDASSLSLHPSSVASSVLTDVESLELSEVVSDTSSLDSPEVADRDSEASYATECAFSSSSSTNALLQKSQKQIRMEDAAKEWFLKSNTIDDWECEKDSILRILSAVDADCKDPERLLAELLDDEEKVWQASAAKTKAAATLGFWDMALMGAVLSLATAVLIKVVRGR